MARPARLPRPGLTLIELLVVLAVLFFLAALLVPAVFRVRRAAARTQSINNLKQIGLATINFADTYRGRLPPIVGPMPGQPNTHGTLHFFILPYVEHTPLYQKADGQVGKNGVYGTPVPVYLHPEDKTAPPGNRYKAWLATTNYPGNWLAFKLGDRRFPASFPDGTSNTLMFAERYQMCNGDPCAWGYASLYYWAPVFAYYSRARFQTAPAQDECDPALAQGNDADGMNAGFADGSVQFLSNRVSPRTWALLCDPSDGQPVGNDF